jgi:hypothetical protein
MKLCTNCLEHKEKVEFYKNKSSPDGCAYWCKECSKEYNRSSAVRARKREWARKKAKEGKLRRANKTEEQKEKTRRSIYRYRKRNPQKAKAREILRNAVRDGKIDRPIGCVAHHWDYSRPLDIRWMSRATHEELHCWCREFKDYYERL